MSSVKALRLNERLPESELVCYPFPTMEQFLKVLKEYWVLWLILILTALGTVGYVFGYRFDAGGVTHVGRLVVTGLPEGSAIYIDKSRRVAASGGRAEADLTPGTHEVIADLTVANDPWIDIVEIVSGTDTIVTPFVIPVKPPVATLTGADAENARALIRANALPTKWTPRTVGDGCMKAYASGNRVIAYAAPADGCTAPAYLACAETSAENPTGACAETIIFTGKDPITALIPYPGRTDAVIVGSGKTVSVVELDPRAPQYVAPIFRGTYTGIAPLATSSIVTTDGIAVLKLSL